MRTSKRVSPKFSSLYTLYKSHIFTQCPTDKTLLTRKHPSRVIDRHSVATLPITDKYNIHNGQSNYIIWTSVNTVQKLPMFSENEKTTVERK